MNDRSSTTHIRGIVLVATDASAEHALNRAATECGWNLTTIHNAIDAFAELALIEHAQRSRCGWGLKRTELAVMVIVNSREWEDFEALRDAMARYMPLAALWVFDNGRLKRHDAPGGTCDADKIGGAVRDAQRPQCHAHAVPAPNQAADTEGDDDRSPSVVSRDELDMLLEVATEPETR